MGPAWARRGRRTIRGVPTKPDAASSLGSEDCAKVLKAMADPTRLRLLRHLVGGPKNVGQLVDELGAEQPIVSHHLAILRRSSLVLEARRGKNVYYELHPTAAKHLSSDRDRIDLGCCAVELRKE